MKILFVGCVSISRTMLTALINDGQKICGIICISEKFRESTSGFDDLSDIAIQYGIPIFKSRRLHVKKCVEFIKNCQPDMLVVYGWQRIIKSEVLSLADKCIGFHASLLPKYRGSAPVNWAIINGETETGVTMFELSEGVDAGPIYGQKAFPIEFEDTCLTVYQKSAKAACELVLEMLRGNMETTSNVSSEYPIMPRRRPEDGLVDWKKTALENYNWIRALTKPYPGAFTNTRLGKIKLWEAKICEKKTLLSGEFTASSKGLTFGCSNGDLLVTNYEAYDDNKR